MDDRNNWNWEPEVREIADAAPLPGCDRQEEWQASPDGESMAAVVVQDDGTFAVRRNDALWEVRAEKIYRCLFAPDNRLTALARLDGEWALMVDDAEVGEHADYYWGTMFSPGGAIAVPMQTGMEYGVMLDGKPWENLYTSATDFAVSANGRSTAAVVQTASLGRPGGLPQGRVHRGRQRQRMGFHLSQRLGAQFRPRRASGGLYRASDSF